jgi:hypothetical protein
MGVSPSLPSIQSVLPVFGGHEEDEKEMEKEEHG